MKLRAILGIALAPTVLLSGCDNIFGLDNYDEPDSMLSGRLVFEGEPVGVRSDGIRLELWQPGFQLLNAITVYAAQDGSFSAALFAGDYKLNLVRGQGPWLVTDDTLQISVSGETTRDFPVTPYYVVTNPQFAYVSSANGGGAEGRINATFNIRSVNTTRQLQMAALYISTTAFADRNNRVVAVEIPRVCTGTNCQSLPATWATAPVTLGANLPANIRKTPSPDPRTHIQARIGLQVAGIQEMIFSPVVEIPLPATP